MTGNRKILEEIHPLQIIREVKKWPLLYTNECPEKANLHIKKKIWKQIAKALFKDWEVSLNETEKDIKIRNLNKRWRNLRDTFKRELMVEKKLREGCVIKKKTYVHFKEMLFLLPHINITENTETRDPKLSRKVNKYFDSQKKQKGRKEKDDTKRKKLDPPDDNPGDNPVIDEDKHFLMSLIPSFKKMSDDEKLTARVEILKVIKNIRSQPSTSDCNIVTDTIYFNAADNDFEEIKEEICDAELEDDISNDNESASDDSVVIQ